MQAQAQAQAHGERRAAPRGGVAAAAATPPPARLPSSTLANTEVEDMRHGSLHTALRELDSSMADDIELDA